MTREEMLTRFICSIISNPACNRVHPEEVKETASYYADWIENESKERELGAVKGMRARLEDEHN